LQKLVSISASLMSVRFSKWLLEMFEIGPAVFDCRAFNIPKEEVCNYFVWRQKDWMRNSVHMLARSVFSHKELQNKKVPDMLKMLQETGMNWHELEPIYRNGTFLYRRINNQGVSYFATDYEANFLTKKYREIIEKYLYGVEQ
ncbi:MAG: tRNA(His) guanylyltransferase Thg1 family protein, partial [Candidatus Heimdallarchaeaceae archaeon]